MGQSPEYLTPHPSVVSRRIADDIVLVHLDTNLIYALSPTAARLWELIGDGCTRTEVEARLAQEFEVEADRLEQEIDGCVALLLEERLVNATGRA